MKTCDVCGRTDKDFGSVFDGTVESMFIGTTIDTCRIDGGAVPGTSSIEVNYGHQIPCELCTDCVQKVNLSLAAHLLDAFGLTVRKGWGA